MRSDTHSDSFTLDNKNAHKLLIWVMLGQGALSLGIGVITDTLALGVIASLIILVVPIYFGLVQPNTVATKHALAIGTQLMASLHIQQTLGMTEMHFQVFVLLAFLSVYRDWKVILTGTVVIATHHVLGFVSQHTMGGVVVFEDASPALIILLTHAAFAVMECSVLAFMAQRAGQEHAVTVQVEQVIKRVMAQVDKIDLSDSNIPQHKDLQQLADMLQAMRRLALQTSHVGTSLVNIVEKVQTSTTELDSSVDEQNTQVMSISDAMTNITERIHHVADLSQNANTIADDAKNNTQSTRNAIESSRDNIGQLKVTLETTATAIADLSAKCQNISTVMQSIKSVAEQTNLLALNAAIESARAGEHGRGFAVVADEVRNLAIKSKESAEEIESITSQLTQSANHSVNNMNECVNIVDLAVESSTKATRNMEEVFSSIEQVNDNVTHVASSTTQQADVSAGISRSTVHLTKLFNGERAQVTSLQHDVSELNSLAEQLNTQLKQFKFQ